MHCLLCSRPAKPIPAINQTASATACEHCGEWEASAPAISTLATMAGHQRMQALRHAQVNSFMGRRPFLHGLG